MEVVEKLTEAELLAIILRVGRGTFKVGVRGQNAPVCARSFMKMAGNNLVWQV